MISGFFVFSEFTARFQLAARYFSKIKALAAASAFQLSDQNSYLVLLFLNSCKPDALTPIRFTSDTNHASALI